LRLLATDGRNWRWRRQRGPAAGATLASAAARRLGPHLLPPLFLGGLLLLLLLLLFVFLVASLAKLRVGRPSSLSRPLNLTSRPYCSRCGQAGARARGRLTRRELVGCRSQRVSSLALSLSLSLAHLRCSARSGRGLRSPTGRPTSRPADGPTLEPPARRPSLGFDVNSCVSLRSHAPPANRHWMPAGARRLRCRPARSEVERAGREWPAQPQPALARPTAALSWQHLLRHSQRASEQAGWLAACFGRGRAQPAKPRLARQD